MRTFTDKAFNEKGELEAKTLFFIKKEDGSLQIDMLSGEETDIKINRFDWKAIRDLYDRYEQHKKTGDSKHLFDLG